MSFRDIVGRRFEFVRQEGSLVIIRELKSATWFHADGSVTLVQEQESKLSEHDSQHKRLNDVKS